MRKLILGAMVASAIVATAASKPVRADTDVYLNFGPPAVRYESAPPPRAGYIWAPGYWDHRGNRHVWVRGHWVRERPGFVYYAPAWRQHGGRWYLERERWERGDRYVRRGGGGDRDRDGVPNAYDRDRDGDGVPNRYDDAPNNPRYR